MNVGDLMAVRASCYHNECCDCKVPVLGQDYVTAGSMVDGSLVISLQVGPVSDRPFVLVLSVVTDRVSGQQLVNSTYGRW